MLRLQEGNQAGERIEFDSENATENRNKLHNSSKNDFDINKEMKNPKFENKRILLVEDNDLNAEILTRVLKKGNIVVERADDGAMAVALFSGHEKNYYDLVFMDVLMPVMGGYEATRTIRQQDREDAKSLPIIAMTANAFARDIEDALEAGMNAHLVKPLDVRALVEVLNSWL